MVLSNHSSELVVGLAIVTAKLVLLDPTYHHGVGQCLGRRWVLQLHSTRLGRVCLQTSTEGT